MTRPQVAASSRGASAPTARPQSVIGRPHSGLGRLHSGLGRLESRLTSTQSRLRSAEHVAAFARLCSEVNESGVHPLLRRDAVLDKLDPKRGAFVVREADHLQVCAPLLDLAIRQTSGAAAEFGCAELLMSTAQATSMYMTSSDSLHPPCATLKPCTHTAAAPPRRRAAARPTARWRAGEPEGPRRRVARRATRCGGPSIGAAGAAPRRPRFGRAAGVARARPCAASDPPRPARLRCDGRV